MNFFLFNRFSLATVLFIFSSLASKAQQNSFLDFQINGWRDTTAYLAYYYGESTFVKDTAKVDANGRFFFKSNELLPQGMYILARGKTKEFEFLIGENQHLQLSTDSTDYLAHMNVHGDVNNRIFFHNIRHNRKVESWLKQLKDSLIVEEQKKIAETELEKLNIEIVDYFAKESKEHQESLIVTILKAQQQIEIPKDLDKYQQVQYYKSHFWDNMDLSNDVFLRLPNTPYRKKMNEYLDNLFVPSYDSLKVGIDYIIAHAKPNPKTYQYAVWNLCHKFQTPKYMGLDELFVYLYDEYFASGEMDFWADESVKNNVKERAEQLRKSLIGKQAQNLILLDENLQKVSLYGIKKKYTVLYFYDPDCGHCKKETPILRDFYKNTKYNVEVFAVSADTSMVKMKKYIEDLDLDWISANGPRTITPHYQKLYDANTTPTTYLLDEKKKIIAKKIKAEKIEEFLDNYERGM